MNTNRTVITLDIETVPSIDPAVHDFIASTIKPPASMTKAETIAKWEIEKKPEAVNDAILKTSFDGAYGSIAVIGASINDDEPVAFFHDTTMPQDPDLEASVLENFFLFVKEAYNGSTQRFPVFVGHNHVGFDMRFMFQRAVVLGIQPPAIIPFNAKPWDESVHDNMIMWAGTRDSISQDKLSRVLGNRGKDGMDGSQVWPAICAGRMKDVAEYCKDDVRDARANYKRMTFQL